MKKLSIIIPAHNEEKRIGKTLKSYSAHFENLRNQKEIDYEIIVIINNTSDKTEEIVKSIQENNTRIKYLNFKQGGKGFAVIQGFKEELKGNSDFIGFVDADMATPAEEYSKLFFSIRNYDGAIADRYLPQSKVHPPVTFRRIVVSRIFNFLIRSILQIPYKDTQCGAKIFRKEAVGAILHNLTMSQWAFDVELLYILKKNNYYIKSSPTIWIDKEFSKINFWKAGPWMFLGIMRLRLLHSPLKQFIRVYDKLIGFIPR